MEAGPTHSRATEGGASAWLRALASRLVVGRRVGRRDSCADRACEHFVLKLGLDSREGHLPENCTLGTKLCCGGPRSWRWLFGDSATNVLLEGLEDGK
jgi:hypothetical protein